MARLEYRQFEESGDFPLLYYYESIPKSEVQMRFACEYFIKDMTVYEKTSCAVEDGVYVVYVQVAADEQVALHNTTTISTKKGIVIELREFRDGTAEYPVAHVYDFAEADEALLHLQANYLTLDGTEWEKTSAEIDEDRRVYVIYAQPNRGGTADGTNREPQSGQEKLV